MIDPILLRTFVAVVDAEGFSRAATHLHLTQSAVSGHLRKLEEQLGKPLLTRTTRRLEITADGQRLLGYARAILALNRDALAELTRAPFQGRIRLGISEDFAHTAFLRTVQAFASQYPGLEIEVQVGIPGALLPLMKANALDLVVGSQCEVSGPGRLLWREPLVWAWSAQAGLQPPTPLPLALFPEPCPYREAALASLARAGVAQRTAMLCSSTASLRAAAQTGFAVAPMALSQITPHLQILEALPALPDAQFRLYTSSSGPQPILDELADAIVQGCRGAD